MKLHFDINTPPPSQNNIDKTRANIAQQIKLHKIFRIVFGISMLIVLCLLVIFSLDFGISTIKRLVGLSASILFLSVVCVYLYEKWEALAYVRDQYQTFTDYDKIIEFKNRNVMVNKYIIDIQKTGRNEIVAGEVAAINSYFRQLHLMEKQSQIEKKRQQIFGWDKASA